MSLLATSYRFERENGNAKALQRAMGRQAARIKVCFAMHCIRIRPVCKAEAYLGKTYVKPSLDNNIYLKEQLIVNLKFI